MKKQLSIFIRLLFFVLYVPCVLLVLFSLSNCEGSGDKLPVVEEEDPVVQQSTVLQPTDCVAVTYYEDWDNDGYGNPNSFVESCTQPADFLTDNTDCDDGAYYVNPGMDEMDDAYGAYVGVYADYLFAGIDNDCDDKVDEDVPGPIELDTEGGNPLQLLH